MLMKSVKELFGKRPYTEIIHYPTHCIVNDSQNHEPRIIKIKAVHQRPTTFQYHCYACLTILSDVTAAFNFSQFCTFAEGLFFFNTLFGSLNHFGQNVLHLMPKQKKREKKKKKKTI